MSATEAFLDLPDVRILFRWDGEEGLPVLLLSNGLGTNLTMWDEQVSGLANHLRLLRYDQRGHGQSSVPPGPYSIEQTGRDVLGLLDALEVQSCSFCGLSMGGTVGQWLGINAPRRIQKLVLSNTAAKIGTEQSWNARINLVRQSGVAAAIPLVLDRWFTADFQKRAPETVARIRTMFLATDPEGYVAGCAAIRDMDLREDVRNIQGPTLIISGADDAVTPPAEGKYLAENIPGASYVELAAAHLSNVEAAPAFNSALLQFLLPDQTA
ncbi:Beta-ketoadipate enol-lactone hydrolase [Acidisarcina polymorpha]|uniref:Beta-ketoadipate enol-lactone hydrolase n=1 Tax=Acidisarcina polymorpha TaxID=2211140 RepID=A0A2Z5G2M5_9BACT|nr:3-oxoadipate enol-lactonase [Acidisarcina polymorpha]AXC12786.1 Beta-ketoadipate enol-lactone hydrolase [Acidisarcina polymorpha]